MTKSHLLVFIIALGLVMLGLLVGPRVADRDQIENCVVNVDLPGPFGISLNCDSPEFMRLANNPAALLEANNTRISRPAMILAASGIAAVIAPLVPKPGTLSVAASRADIDPARVSSAMATMGAAYAAYLLLNLVILCGAFLIMRSLMMKGSSAGAQPDPPASSGLSMALAGFGLLLISNDVVKAFAWSPHTQMFNILVPVLCIWTLWMSWKGQLVERWQSFLFALGIGLGVAAYATFLVCLVCMLAPWIVRQWLRGFPDGFWRLALRAAALAGIALLSSIAWYLFVKITTGGFYVHEAKFNQVIWMADAWRAGPLTLLSAWLGNALDLVMMALPQLLSTAAAVAWTIVMLGRGKKGALPALKAAGLAIAFCGVVAASFVAFYATVGFIRPRLAFGIVPPFVVAAGIFALAAFRSMPARDGRILGTGYAAIGTVAAVVTVVKDGPWS